MGKESFMAPLGFEVMDGLWMMAGTVYGTFDGRGGTSSALSTGAISG